MATRRVTRIKLFAALLGSALVGCSGSSTPDVTHVDAAADAADSVVSPDATADDVAPTDAVVDTSTTDIPAPDTSAADVSTPDVLVSDVSTPDVPVPDVSTLDVIAPDALVPDAPASDALVPDASAPDVSVDAGPRLSAWSRRFGEASDQDCFAIALDAAGDVFLSTYIIGTVNFGNGPLSGMDRIAIAKLGPTGDALWSRIYPNGGHQYSTGIAVASSGAIVIEGGFENTLNFGGAALVSAGGDDVFSAGLTAAGATSWSHRYGDASLYQKGLDVAIDRGGNAVFVGELSGGATFGTTPFTGNNRDVFVVKLDPGGNHLWSHVWGDPAMQVATGVAVDGSDNIVVVGRLDGRVDFGTGPVGSGQGLFLARLSPSGAPTFVRTFATEQGQVMRSRVATDAAGNIYVAGSVLGAIDLGDGMIAGRGDFDVFVARFDPTGRLVWHREFGDAMGQQMTDLAVNAAGDIALVGLFDGTVDFGGGPLTSRGGDDFVGGDAFVVRLNADGSHRFSARYGDAAAQRAQSVAIDARGDVVVAGEFRGQIDLGTGTLTSAGGTDIFVARLPIP